MTGRRAQSQVVGVVLLLGITSVALGGLTAVVGGIVDSQTAAADEARVASALDSGLRPLEQTGPNRIQIRFSDGRLRTVERDLRVLDDSGVRRQIAIGGLVYTSGTNRVSFVGSSVVRGRPGEAWIVRGPPVTVTQDNETLVVGAVTLNASTSAVSGTGGVTARLQTNVTHAHEQLPRDVYRIAIETKTPAPLARQFRRRGITATVTDIDGDGVPSVVGRVDGRETIELVVHQLHTEVTSG